MYRLERAAINRVLCVKDLGVLLDSKLIFNSHESQVVSSCFRLLGVISQFSKGFSTVYLLFVLYRSIVLPKHDFFSVTWNSLSMTASKNLERIEKGFASI